MTEQLPMPNQPAIAGLRDAIKKKGTRQDMFLTRCLIPRFDCVILSQEWKEALWDKFVTGAPRPRTPSELQYSYRELRSRSSARNWASTPRPSRSGATGRR